ncbi:hypothetical protein LCGC14_3081430, partial [marine sediment metagenome]
MGVFGVQMMFKDSEPPMPSGI